MLCPFGLDLVLNTEPLLETQTLLETTMDAIMDNEDVETHDNKSNENELSHFISIDDNYNKYVMIDGNMVHKSNAVNSIINCITKTSTDRCYSVFGPREISIGGSTDNSNNSINLIRISDTILSIAIFKTGCINAVIFTLNRIKHNDEFVLSIESSNIKEAKFYGTILNINSKAETNLIWSREYGDSLIFDGQ